MLVKCKRPKNSHIQLAEKREWSCGKYFLTDVKFLHMKRGLIYKESFEYDVAFWLHWPCFQRIFLTLISVLSTKLKLRMQLASSLLSQDQSSFHALLCEAAIRCTAIHSTLG